ncbi:MAG: hypothetical protein ABSH12_10005 [Endomicrobiales bacterium]|jgi:hypothetical protein
MTKTLQVEFEFLAFILIGAGAGMGIAYYAGHKPPTPTKIYLPVMQKIQTPTAAPTLTPVPTSKPTPVPVLTAPAVKTPTPLPSPTSQVFYQTSPDGTMELTMTVTNNLDGTKTFNFVTSDINAGNQHAIYTVTSATDNMSIPFNAWSPGNTYVFINDIAPAGTQALIFRSDGTPIGSNQSVSANALFAAANTGNTYQEATGWSSDTLLIINTTTGPGGPKSASYWLSLPDLSIIPLATQF